MSHELRTPLSAILGFAQLMESGSPLPTPTQKRSIDQILQAGWYLLELINEILDLALIESGKLSLSPEPVLLSELLADCLAMIEPMSRKAGIAVHLIAPDGPWLVKADRTRFKQVVVNLLSNAVKYNRPDGTVEVSCRVMPDNRIRVSFQDTGEGLTADKLARLFQPFDRLGRESGLEEGTGIGLVVSKRLIELMGGRIGAASTVGVGSQFWIELNATTVLDADPIAPFATPRRTPALEAQAAPVRTVLCVEDNPANLLLVGRLLERRPDIRLITAKDGRRGIEQARELLPDVILMDINLPGISGITALKILAGDPLTHHIPVIALSANAMPKDIATGLAAGFFRYLTKPIKVDEFMATLDLALDSARPPPRPAYDEAIAP
jgi:CheY-like chemotaxis protein